MSLWKKVKHISLPKLIQFSWVLMQKPRLILPIWYATKETLWICHERYGKTHQGRGKANAFRHALWNYIICEKTMKITKNASKSVIWTQKVVDFYEKVTKNEMLDRHMDYHNNAIGRDIFFQNTFKIHENMIDFIQNEAEKAQKVSKMDDFDVFMGQLVYITD